MYGCMDVWMYGLRDCVKEMMMFWFSSHGKNDPKHLALLIFVLF